jgi:hypothetical protein
MRRGIGIVLLALGTVAGFGIGFAHLGGYCRHGCGWDGPGMYGHGHFGDGPRNIEDRAADACVRAAERVLAERKATAGTPATPAPQAPAPAPGAAQ